MLLKESFTEMSPQVESEFLEHFIYNNGTRVVNFQKNGFTFVIFGKDVHNK